ncbi:hypothetical protein [Streptomyces sp. NPDC059909]|uniref:hypothetical protein n=1 Tax=Streptomyces sp. NPDC059909 TaxID=3346998 RepID=UPI00365F0AD6
MTTLWSLGLSVLTGLGAAALPRGVLRHGVRGKAVFAQHLLMILAPILAALD